MITSKFPQSRQDLQADVARLLAECDFDVEVEKTLAAARGVVEIDVYAEEQFRGRKYTIICECKFWQNRIPQNVIHGFRTVVSDIGAQTSDTSSHSKASNLARSQHPTSRTSNLLRGSSFKRRSKKHGLKNISLPILQTG